MATVGDDAGPYLSVSTSSVWRAITFATYRQFTAQAFITTDLDDNQITAFHPAR